MKLGFRRFCAMLLEDIKESYPALLVVIATGIGVLLGTATAVAFSLLHELSIYTTP